MQRKILSWLLPSLLAAGLPSSISASVSANLAWTASADPSVTGYNIYYGSASRQYTNMVTVDAVTNATIPGLNENTTYYFAAKAHNSTGNESDFSNEAAFAGVTATPNGLLRLKTLPASLTGDPLVFSFGANQPSGATINATNGTIYWTPGRAYAATTNYLTVVITDTANPALSTTETMVVIISDYLDVQMGNTAVGAGQSGSLPLTAATSGSLTNLQFTLDWPGDQLVNPTLTLVSPVIGGSVQYQNHQLAIQLQTDPAQPLTGTNQVAQVNFQAASGTASVILRISAGAVSGNTADGVAYANVLGGTGQVAVVGAAPMLQPQPGSAQGRTLSLFANPGNYELQYTTSLAPPNWTTLTTYEQTNLAQTVSVDGTEPAIFYRLHQL